VIPVGYAVKLSLLFYALSLLAIGAVFENRHLFDRHNSNIFVPRERRKTLFYKLCSDAFCRKCFQFQIVSFFVLLPPEILQPISSTLNNHRFCLPSST